MRDRRGEEGEEEGWGGGTGGELGFHGNKDEEIKKIREGKVRVMRENPEGRNLQDMEDQIKIAEDG